MHFYNLIQQFKAHKLRLFIGSITGERIDFAASNSNDKNKVLLHVCYVELDRDNVVYDIALKLNEEIVMQNLFIEQEEYDILIEEAFRKIEAFYKSK